MDVLLMAAEAYNRSGLSDVKARILESSKKTFGDLNHDISASEQH
jgi:hypothetical protein